MLTIHDTLSFGTGWLRRNITLELEIVLLPRAVFTKISNILALGGSSWCIHNKAPVLHYHLQKSRILLGCPLQYLTQLQRSGCVASCWARLSLLGDLVDLVEEDNAKCLSMLSKRFVIDPMALRRRPWFSVKTSDTDGQTPTNVLPSWRFLEMCTA